MLAGSYPDTKNVPWIMSIFSQRQLDPIQGRSAVKIRTAIIETITQSLFDESTSLPIGPCRKQVNLFAREAMWWLRKQPGKKAYLVKRIVIILYPAGIAFTGDANGTNSISKDSRGKEEAILTLIPMRKTDCSIFDCNLCHASTWLGLWELHPTATKRGALKTQTAT